MATPLYLIRTFWFLLVCLSVVAERVVFALVSTLPGRYALEPAVVIAFVTMAENQQVQDSLLEEFERGLNGTANAAATQASENNASQASTLSREWESVSVNNTSIAPPAASAATVPQDPWQGKELPRQAQQTSRTSEDLWKKL